MTKMCGLVRGLLLVGALVQGCEAQCDAELDACVADADCMALLITIDDPTQAAIDASGLCVNPALRDLWSIDRRPTPQLAAWEPMYAPQVL